jgi:hypothetical protein
MMGGRAPPWTEGRAWNGIGGGQGLPSEWRDEGMPGQLTPGRKAAAWAAAAMLAFSVPFGVSALRGGDGAPAPAAALEPPAIAGVPAPPALHRVAALPAPPRPERRRRTPRAAAKPRPAATATPVATAAPAPAAVPAPAAAPKAFAKSFDSTG